MLMHIYRMLKIIHKVENWEKKKKKTERWVSRYSKLISWKNTITELTLRKQQASTEYPSH